MTPDYCELDPDGDVVLVLERWHEEDEGAEGVTTDDPTSPTEEITTEAPPVEEAPPDEWPVVEEIPVDDPPASIDETLAAHVQDLEKHPNSEHVRIRVSSKHLILASPYFRRMLQGGFKESEDLRITGAAEIPLVDDHPAALVILLNIIHGHTRRVPRDVDFRMLMRIAILVDKYQFHEVAEMFTDTWVEKLKGRMPNRLKNDLRAAICIYWVFGKSSEFKRATKTALMESEGRIEENGLPIPSLVFDKIDRDRQEAFQQLFSTLRGLLEEYHEPHIKCGQSGLECDSMVYGGLILRLKAINLFPIPENPYKNLCLKDASQKLRNMDVPTLCDRIGSRHFYLVQQCTIKPRIEDSINSLQERMKGLDLETFRNGRGS